MKKRRNRGFTFSPEVKVNPLIDSPMMLCNQPRRLSWDYTNVKNWHSRPQSPRSFWPVAGIESSGLVQHRKSAIHGLIVKSSKSDWLRIRNEYSAHAQKIGSGQSSRSLPQARRIVGSGDENGRTGYSVTQSISHQASSLMQFF